MQTAARAGGLYFLLVFAAGFALGTIRTLLIAPLLGETGSVALELPFMLLVSWFACNWVLKTILVPSTLAARLLMGGTALILLLMAEALLSVTLGGLSLQEHMALYTRAPALLGLAGQLAFAAFPLMRRSCA